MAGVMFFQRYRLRWSFILLVVVAVTGLFLSGLHRLAFDTDLVSSLPQDDPVLADARRILASHPIQDRVVIDVGLPQPDPEGLVRAAAVIEQRLRESGLFTRVGLEQEQRLVPELFLSVTGHLPVLLSAAELEENVRPLLDPSQVREALAEHVAQLGNLEGIGQAAMIARDPLNLRNLILSRLSHLAPARNVQVYRGRLMSADGRHLLIVAEPVASGADTSFARKISALIGGIGAELNREGLGDLTLTPAGTYRAALDNEESMKRGTERAVLFSTVAIIALLLVAFPRPLIGLLALLPSVVGTMLGLFVYSLLHPSITLMAIGFGSAIISFTVDYGIAYLLFLDRSHQTYGLEATREVWSLGLLAMLTTAVSFAFLAVSGFSALAQIGEFSALGVLFTYIFVHAIYPVIFPVMPPAAGKSRLPVQDLANRLASGRSRWKPYAALGLALILLLFAKPVFRVDLGAMNSVSRESLAAEKLLSDVWGNLFTRIYVMTEGRDVEELQRKGDRLAALLEADVGNGTLDSAFTPSQVFPGGERAGRNLAAWRAFWHPERVAALRETIEQASLEMGFARSAFSPFFSLVETKEMEAPAVPAAFHGLLGIAQSRDRSGWLQVSTLAPGSAYRGDAFDRRLRASGLARMFDPGLFGQRLADALLSGFIRMALMVGAMTLAVAFIYLLDWRLTLLGLLPTVFALICTLGTLNLLGQPLGIPTVMVAVVVIGMGSDYALYLVRSHQRYMDEDHPSMGLIRLSVFLSFATTLMGFGVLALSGHALLKSAGIALALGIGYSYLGAVSIAPPLLARLFAPAGWPEGETVPGSRRHRSRALTRYRHMEAYPRLFARFKILLDPMFPRLAGFLDSPRHVIDVGCGYGVPSVWLLCLFPRARVYGIDPDRKRVRIAARAFAGRGFAEAGGAPGLPASAPDRADTALMLDMMHLISDGEALLTLQRLRERLDPGGRLVIRATVPAGKRPGLLRRIEMRRLAAAGRTPRYRSVAEVKALLSGAGFQIERVEPDAAGREEMWFVGRT